MNIFEQYGIKEVADVCLYSIELDDNDEEIYTPILYLDTLKISQIEETAQTVYAQGGLGNEKLIGWDYGRDINITLEDALFTPRHQQLLWQSKQYIKNTKIYLRNFEDFEDNEIPSEELIDEIIEQQHITGGTQLEKINKAYAYWLNNYKTTGAVLTIKYCKDFFVIAENNSGDYVGGTSIYCWLVSGTIIDNQNVNRIYVKDLILFYREQTQKWYFYNGKAEGERTSYAIQYQYGQENFDLIKSIYSNKTNVYEPVANETIQHNENLSSKIYIEGEPKFLTQSLFINGLKTDDCVKNGTYLSYIETIEEPDYNEQIYRFCASIDVEYNSNITLSQGLSSGNQQGLNEPQMIERIENVIADKTFCIDTDVNLKHWEFKNINQYKKKDLQVFINPITMIPYVPNCFEYKCINGKIIYGNLRVIKKGERYFKYERVVRQKQESIGQEIIIDSIHYPGICKLVGSTYVKDRYGKERKYQIEIPQCKILPGNSISLNAAGEPATFSLKMSVLKHWDNTMMKITWYDTDEDNKIVRSAAKPEYKEANAQWILSNETSYGDLDIEMEVKQPEYLDNNENEITVDIGEIILGQYDSSRAQGIAKTDDTDIEGD